MLLMCTPLVVVVVPLLVPVDHGQKSRVVSSALKLTSLSALRRA